MGTARRQLGYVSSLTTQTSPVSPQTLDVEFLLVGGGGGGGGGASNINGAGGGGGAGGFKTGSGIIGRDTYTVKVGAGGAGGPNNSYPTSGTGSSFIDSVNGGGNGGQTNDNRPQRGNNGGSGGGGAWYNQSGGTGVSGEGNNGGTGYVDSTYRTGGGGGGAGSAGGNAGALGGNGGSASTNDYTGSTISYSGGGGGGGSGTGGTNAGSGTGSTGGNAVANRGGGGGGGTNTTGVGGNGGSGIVHFQDTNLGSSSAPFYVAPGFIANVGFTQLLIENAAQAGKRMRIFYGVDIDFQAGVTSSTNTNISNSLPASKIPVYQAGLEYSSSFKSTAAMAANTPETIFTPAANANGAIIHAAYINSSAVNNTTNSTLIAKASAPASITDGDVILAATAGFSVSTTIVTYGNLVQPIKIPAGKGLYAICSIGEASAFRSSLFTLL